MIELNTSQIGLGTFPFSGVFSSISYEQAREIIIEFFAKGGKYIETAPVYSINNIELKEILIDFPRDLYYLATKCVTDKDDLGKVIRSGKEDFIEKQCCNELKRLNTDYLDLFQAHIVPADVKIKEIARILQSLKEQGLIREIGVSNVTSEQIKEFTEDCEVKFVQNRFSLIHQKEQKKCEEICIENNILFNPYQIIERGLLTSSITNNGNWNTGDIRNTKQEYNNEPLKVIREWVNNYLRKIADNLGVSIETLVIAWTLKQKQVKVAVIGVTKKEQLTNLFEGQNLLLNNILMEEINFAFTVLENEILEKYNLTIPEFRGLKQ